MNKGGEHMTIYIEPFWAGVLAVILAELAIIIVLGIRYSIKQRRNKSDE